MGLLDEAMKDDNTFANQRTKERTPNTLLPTSTNFKQPITKRLGVRQTKVGARHHNLLGNPNKTSGNTYRPRLDGVLYLFVKELDLIGHEGNIA